MKHTSSTIGELVRRTRKAQGLTQQSLALACGTGQRFIGELENGKPTCEFAKVLHVLQTLGIEMQFELPLMELNE